MWRWVAAASAAVGAVLAQDGDEEERYYRLRRQLLERAAERLIRAGDGYARLRDPELSELCWAMGEMLSVVPNDTDRRPQEGRPPVETFRAHPGALVEAAREALPPIRRLQLAAQEARIERDQPWLEAARALLEHAAEVAQTLRRINDFRKLAQLPPVGISGELTAGCQLHVRYMAVAGHFSDSERRSEPAYTAEGAKAGRASLIAEVASPPLAVDQHFSTLFARAPLLDPGFRKTGIGLWPVTRGWYVAIDVKSAVDPKDGIVVYPVAGQKGVPRALGRDRPDPLPDGAGPAGCPITVALYGAPFDQVRARADVTARLEDAWGKSVPTHISTPSSPANRTKSDNGRCVALIPKEPLKKRALYRAVFELPLESGRRRLETWFITEGE